MRFNHGSKGFAVLIPSHISNANQILFHIQISPKLTLFACFNNSRTYWTRKILISRNNPLDGDLLKTCIFSVSFFQGKSSSNNKAGRKKKSSTAGMFFINLDVLSNRVCQQHSPHHRERPNFYLLRTYLRSFFFRLVGIRKSLFAMAPTWGMVLLSPSVIGGFVSQGIRKEFVDDAYLLL